MATYQTIADALHLPAVTITGSRFIVDIRPARSADDALAQVAAVREQYPDASHHCWAYRLHHQSQTRSSDDGEPGGSAGRPILAQIEGHELFDLVVVVTRYFGGTKLGVGGLIRAYGGTAGKALDQVVPVDIHETKALAFAFAYELTKAVEGVLRQYQLTPVKTSFDTRVSMWVDVPVDVYSALRDTLTEKTAAQVHFR